MRVECDCGVMWQGLSDMVFPHQPTLTLVSNGAECLLVGKKLLLDHATPDFLARLQEAVGHGLLHPGFLSL